MAVDCAVRHVGCTAGAPIRSEPGGGVALRPDCVGRSAFTLRSRQRLVSVWAGSLVLWADTTTRASWAILIAALLGACSAVTPPAASPPPPQPPTFLELCTGAPSAEVQATVEVLLEQAGTTDCQAAWDALSAREVLHVQGNGLRDLTPLAHLTQLRTLTLQDNRIADLGPLRDLRRLEVLWLAGNPVSDLGPLAGLHQLEDLWLTGREATITQCPTTPDTAPVVRRYCAGACDDDSPLTCAARLVLRVRGSSHTLRHRAGRWDREVEHRLVVRSGTTALSCVLPPRADQGTCSGSATTLDLYPLGGHSLERQLELRAARETESAVQVVYHRDGEEVFGETVDVTATRESQSIQTLISVSTAVRYPNGPRCPARCRQTYLTLRIPDPEGLPTGQ